MTKLLFKTISVFTLILFLTGGVFFDFSYFGIDEVTAGELDELEREIESRQERMKQIEEEIRRFEVEIGEIRSRQSTLQGQIEQIDLSRQRLSADINLTEERIGAKELNLTKIDQDIDKVIKTIADYEETIAGTLRELHWLEQESVNVFYGLLFQDDFQEALVKMDHLNQLQNAVHDQLDELEEKQSELNERRKESKQEQEKLLNLRDQLANQKALADNERQVQADLLATTRSEESTYQSLLADRQEMKRQVEQEIAEAEQKIQIIIDPEQLPKAGPVLSWPVDNIRITQYFGRTPFATANPQVYTSGEHNGIDLGLNVGEPIRAALSGRVIGVGNTDKTCPGASWGKWILIEHENGLSTLYAHLSVIEVREGQMVNTRDLIGLAGNSGFSTGPHLHFTVYASRGVEIGHLQSQVPGCGVYRIPLGAETSYLNPLTYLSSY